MTAVFEFLQKTVNNITQGIGFGTVTSKTRDLGSYPFIRSFYEEHVLTFNCCIEKKP